MGMGDLEIASHASHSPILHVAGNNNRHVVTST